MSLLKFLRPVCLLAGLTLGLSGGAQAAVIVNFSGTCTVGCTGTATGVLSLVDTYVLGSVVTLPDLLQFDYSSNTLSFTMLPPTSVGGGSTVPGSTAFDIADGVHEFRILNGIWDVFVAGGSGYVFDQGGNAGDFTATPEPSSFVLVGGAVAALAALRRRKR